MITLQDVLLIHKDLYQYRHEQFPISNYGILDIVCSIHGAFTQIARNHLRTCGCPECGKIKSALSRTVDAPTFLLRAHTVHKEKYTYDLVGYVNLQSTIKIICPEHGAFTQKATKHVNGQGCPQCYLESKKYTHAEFISLANEKHGDTYDYSLVEYKGSTMPISIICREHGIFLQEPRLHLSGAGCQVCGITKRSFGGRYRDNRPVILYIVYLADLQLWKIGVTNRSIPERMAKVSRKYEVLLSIVFTTASDAYIAERVLLNMTKESGNICLAIPGYTEIRSVNPLDTFGVRSYIDGILKNK